MGKDRSNSDKFGQVRPAQSKRRPVTSPIAQAVGSGRVERDQPSSWHQIADRIREVLPMSATAEVLCSPGQSRTTMRELPKWNTVAAAHRFLAADLMPRGTGVMLPQLAGIEPELQWVSDDRSLVTLAKALVELGIGDPHKWARCSKSPSKYVVTTARR